MASRKQRATASSFVARHGLWNDAQADAAIAVDKAIKRHKLELVRFSFCDQHGILRGKTLVASEAARAHAQRRDDDQHAARQGHLAPHGLPGVRGRRRARPARHAGRRQHHDGGRSDDVPRAALGARYRLDAVRHRVSRRQAGPASRPARSIATRWRGSAAPASTTWRGSRSSSICSRSRIPRLATADLTWPPAAPAVSHTTHGFQYLTESRFDQVDPIMRVLRETVMGLGLPLRSLEVELGPSQYEFTFAPQTGMAPADTMVLFRSALKQVARRHGHLVSFMCRPTPAPCFRQRLASASVAARRDVEGESVRLARRRGAAVATRPRVSSPACSRMRARRPPSRRRRSTATSATTASIRWRRSRPSGRATIAAPWCG